MKKIYFLLYVTALVSCNSGKDDYLITRNSAGLVKIGMDINDARNLFSGDSFENIDLAKFGLDGGDTGILVKNPNEPVVVFWTNTHAKKVNGIICLSSKYHTKSGISPKMTVEELKKIIPHATIQVNNISPSHEFIELVTENIYLDFLSTNENRIGKYKLNNPEEATPDMRPDAAIDNIWIKEK